MTHATDVATDEQGYIIIGVVAEEHVTTWVVEGGAKQNGQHGIDVKART